jgi:flagellar basal-body rod protein FlgG
MNGAFYIGATGLDAQQRALDVVSNNISNINTTAYKRSSARFSELLVGAHSLADGETVIRSFRGDGMNGVEVASAPRVWTQGDLRQTASELDLAIDGAGFIPVMAAEGRSLLWRGGALKLSGDGYLATADGLPLQAMIAVPQDAKAVVIARDGTVSATIDGQAEPRELGKIDLAYMADPSLLTEAGAGYFESDDPSAVSVVAAGEEGAGFLVQGSLEGANVELSAEMIQLLVLQRAYAASAQVVQAGDTLMAISNSLRR